MHPTFVGSGKVREIFAVGADLLLLVASDRISAFDVVLDRPIPDKGKVLTGLSHFWLEAFPKIPNHLVSVSPRDFPDVGLDDLEGRAMLCRRAEPIPIELVVRGYLSGSGWRDYLRTGEICGHALPPGLVESEALPHPIVTPATKAVSGHDENISEVEAAVIAGPGVYGTARFLALDLYRQVRARAAERGIIVADTKFEFGVVDGEVVLIDEVLPPDSSRFWPVEGYCPGGAQPSFDKQGVRDWLDLIGWDHAPPGPALPDEVVDATRGRYIEAYERLALEPFGAWLERTRA